MIDSIMNFVGPDGIVLIWGILLLVGTLIYVLLDGFVLGIGLMYPFFTESERNISMRTAAPFWDGNQTWLILAAGGLYALFPLAYATLWSEMYLILVLMLVSLVFRGISFEMRHVSRNPAWNWSFFVGSLGATFAQSYLITVMFLGLNNPWTNMAVVVVFAAMVLTYVTLGIGWLVLKTEGELEEKARRWNPLKMIPVHPYLASVAVTAVSYLVVMIYKGPWIIVGEMSLWDTHAHPGSLWFLLAGTVVLLPVILAYTAYNYWIFRGKVTDDKPGY